MVRSVGILPAVVGGSHPSRRGGGATRASSISDAESHKRTFKARAMISLAATRLKGKQLFSRWMAKLMLVPSWIVLPREGGTLCIVPSASGQV